MQTTIHVSNTDNTADYDKYGNSRGNFSGWKREPWKRSGKHPNRSRSRSRPFSRFVFLFFYFFPWKQFTVGLNSKRSRSGRDFPVPFSTLGAQGERRYFAPRVAGVGPIQLSRPWNCSKHNGLKWLLLESIKQAVGLFGNHKFQALAYCTGLIQPCFF